MTTATTALGTFARRATTVGSGLTSALSLPILAVGAVMVQQSVKIEEAWNEVRATYNATPDEIERLIAPTGDLGKAVTSLSLKYGLARDEVIELLAKLSQMGFTGKDATDTLTQGLEFAVAAGLKLEDGLNLSTAIVNTFGLKGQALTDTLRGLNVVENETAASGFDLMKALTRAGGAAQAMTGPTFTSSDAVASLAAGMAVLKANGQETARSADALRAIFQRMYTPTKEVQGLFDKMGVSLKTAKGEIVPFPEVLQNIADNFEKLTPYERLQFGKKLIGVEFGPLFQTLIKDVQKGADGLSIYNNTLDEFADTAKGAEAYAHELEVRQNSLRVSLGKVRAAFGLLVDVLRPVLAPIIQEIAGYIAAFATRLSKASPQAQKFAVIIGLVVAVIGPLVLIVGALAAALSAISGPVLLVVAGIAGLVVAIIAILKRGGPVAAFLKGSFTIIWNNIREGVMSLVGAVQNLLPYLKLLGVFMGATLIGALIVLSAAFRGIAAVLEFVAGIFGWFYQLVIDGAMWMYDVLVGHSIIPDLVEAVIFWFKLLATVVIGVVEAFWQVLVTAFKVGAAIVQTIFSILVGIVQAVWNVLVTAVTAGMNIIVTVFREAWNVIVTMFTLVWTVISTVVKTGITVMMTVISTVMSIIVTVFRAAWDIMVAAVKLVWSVIQTVVTTAINVVRSVVQAVMAAIRGDWSGAWGAIKNAASTVWNGIKALWSAFWTFIKSVMSTAFSTVKSVWTTAWNGIKTAASTVWNAIKSLWSAFWTALKSLATSGLNVIKSVISGVMNTIKSIISNGINAAKNSWSSAWNGFRSIVSSVVGGIRNIINGLIGTVENVVSKVSSALSKVKNAASSVGGFLGFNRGGLVPGAGNDDSVPAMLTPGEFVVTKRAVRRIGVANLARANRQGGGDDLLSMPRSGGVPGAIAAGSSSRLAALAAEALERARRGGTVNVSTGPTIDDGALRGAGGARQGATRNVTYEFNTAVYNPVAEKASDSVQRRVTRLADMGMFASAGKDAS